MENNNDVIIIELDKPRELRFKHSGLKRLAAHLGKSVEGLMGDGELDFGQIEVILFYGLKSDDEKNHGGKLELAHMEDLLDQAPSLSYYMEKMAKALSIAFNGANAEEGNGKGK